MVYLVIVGAVLLLSPILFIRLYYNHYEKKLGRIVPNDDEVFRELGKIKYKWIVFLAGIFSGLGMTLIFSAARMDKTTLILMVMFIVTFTCFYYLMEPMDGAGILRD